MGNPEIARILRYYRKLRNLSVEAVSKNLEEYEITAKTKTIYSWENGRTLPNTYTFMHLCKMYEINDVLGTFGYREDSNNNLVLTEDEEIIIVQYRKHPEMHNAIKKLLNLPSQLKN